MEQVKVTLKGDVREFAAGMSVADIAKEIGAGLYKAACAGKIDGKMVDLRTPVTTDCTLEILTFQDPDGKHAYWHTAAHVMAQAVKRLYPNAKLAIGPAIDNGFYYDIDLERPLTPDDLPKIEAEIKKIIKENLPLERFELPSDQAKTNMQEDGQDYKVELIEEHSGKGEAISFYRQGEFTDLCAGPHLMSTGCLKAVKITNATAAYWRGDANKKQLQRLYGIAFPKASELEEYLQKVEEAKKRDHNLLGRQLGYFTTVDYIGQGLPVLMPNGARVVQTLSRFVEDEEEKRGYLLTKTPFMAKSDLYKISGHWDHYRESMFVLGDPESDKEVFALRPMTCPFQFQVYLNKKRSYRDLPMRLNETSTLFRNEASGEMHGLIRVRQFTISEGHIACLPEQLEQEFIGCVELTNYLLDTVGLKEDITYRFSKWDENNKEKYIGSPEEWETVQDRMREILNDMKIEYTEADGEAAFYGPKLDIQMKNVHGKEDTLVTVQIDFQLAERFGMTYVDADGQTKYPYVIHRTSLGCYERTLALLIEKYAGALPMWLMPEQVRILPLSDRLIPDAKGIEAKLQQAGLRVTTDTRSEKIGYKIREAQLEKIPYMLVVGDKELEQGTVAVRSRKDGDLGTMPLDEFLSKALHQVATKSKE